MGTPVPEHIQHFMHFEDFRHFPKHSKNDEQHVVRENGANYRLGMTKIVEDSKLFGARAQTICEELTVK